MAELLASGQHANPRVSSTRRGVDACSLAGRAGIHIRQMSHEWQTIALGILIWFCNSLSVRRRNVRVIE